VLVTVTSRLRIHRDEVLCALVKGNAVVLSFVSMKPIKLPIDDLTDEARAWLLPSLAPREIPVGDDLDGEELGGGDAEIEADELGADERFRNG
jgi:hypothetical protein